MERIIAYKLLEPEELALMADVLPRLLFNLPKDPNEYDFFISPISGWLFYTNYEQIRKNEKQHLLPSSLPDIKRIANNFFIHANQRLKVYGEKNKNFKIHNLFPRNLDQVKVFPYFHDDNGLIDHWVVRFQPMLRTGIRGTSMAPVVGTSITLRIGNYGQIIALTSNWRPITGSSYVSFLEFNDEHSEETEGHEHSEGNHIHEHEESDMPRNNDKEVEPILCYWDCGGETYLNFYLPMHYSVEGHHFGFQPACKEAMIPKIIEDHYENQVDLYASVKGGKGQYTLQWATWDIVDYRDTYKEYNDATSISLTEGAYHVRLTVIDKITKVVAQVQNMVFVHSKTNNPTIV